MKPSQGEIISLAICLLQQDPITLIQILITIIMDSRSSSTKTPNKCTTAETSQSRTIKIPKATTKYREHHLKE